MSVLNGSSAEVPAPATRASLSRVGLAGVEKVILIGGLGGQPPQLFSARLDCSVDLPPDDPATPSWDFEEAINEVVGEVIVGESAFRAEQLAQHVAERVRELKDVLRVEVTIAARYPEYKAAPVSGLLTQEIYTLYGSAVASRHGTRRMVGVAAQGMVASPRAQQLVAERARARLSDQGFADEEIDRILAAVPVATHDQRGVGTLRIGCPEDCDADLEAATLLGLVEGAMSSEIYELMKRRDEGAVVERAHRRPRSVDDCVREMVRAVTERFGHLPDDVFVSARQVNVETVHQHDVVAERHGLLGEMRRELSFGERGAPHTSMREWLDAAGP
nr:GTP cyclohydrolase I FolE2 [Solirubrobacterales bacterium]